MRVQDKETEGGERERDRERERGMKKKQERRRGGETTLPIFFSLLPPPLPKNQPLISASDSAKLISGRQREKGRKRVETSEAAA